MHLQSELIDHVSIVSGDERARVYAAGGIGFDHRLEFAGGKRQWIVNDRPSLAIARLAEAVHRAYVKR